MMFSTNCTCLIRKCGCLSEPEGRVGTGAFTDQAYTVSRKYHESLQGDSYYIAADV